MLSKWVEITSMNGALDWYKSRDNKSHFVFWSIVMLILIVVSIYSTFRTVQDYFLSPTSTDISTKQKASFFLPEILICFNGGLNVKKMMDANLSKEFVEVFSAAMRDSIDNFTLLENVEFALKEYMQMNNINLQGFLLKFGYSCEDVVRRTSIERGSKRKVCENVTYLYSHTFGRCFVYTDVGKQLYPGLDGGIQLFMKTPSDSFYEFNPSLAGDYSLSNSFSISLDQHFKWITRRSLLVPSNMRAEITLQPKLFKRLAKNDPCDSSGNVYSSNTCFHRCYAQSLFDYCGCYPLEYLESPEQINHCNICTPGNCTGSYSTYLAQPCEMSCRPKCEEWVFDSTVTLGTLESKPINESQSIVSIGYNTMTYMLIEEVDSFTFYMGMANVGGQAGLWLGVSIVTIIQGVFYFVLAICDRCSVNSDVKRFKETVNRSIAGSRPSTQRLRNPSVKSEKY